jgi:hypothetical protein
LFHHLIQRLFQRLIANRSAWKRTGNDTIRYYASSGSFLFFLKRVKSGFLLTRYDECFPDHRPAACAYRVDVAEALVERTEDRHWYAELHRLRGVFLAAIGTDEAQIEASFSQAIRTAREQKSVSLEKRAEATYAEYRRQRASSSGGRGFRLPLC